MLQNHVDIVDNDKRQQDEQKTYLQQHAVSKVLDDNDDRWNESNKNDNKEKDKRVRRWKAVDPIALNNNWSRRLPLLRASWHQVMSFDSDLWTIKEQWWENNEKNEIDDDGNNKTITKTFGLIRSDHDNKE